MQSCVINSLWIRMHQKCKSIYKTLKVFQHYYKILKKKIAFVDFQYKILKIIQCSHVLVIHTKLQCNKNAVFMKTSNFSNIATKFLKEK